MQRGFKVVAIPEVLPAEDKRYRWRRVNAFDFTIEAHPNCPIDGTAMETIAALVSLTLPERIRIGACARCGLVGYIDRPSQADIDRYYAETWMGEETWQAIAEAKRRVDETDATLNSLPASVKALPALEIGCGYGGMVRAMQRAGFTDIDATEHCPSRAEAVRQVFGVNVTTEMPQRRYGLIVSHHVLEHCCDPAGLIRACAERQEQGDWMWHTLPNYTYEPSCGVLFFLPHLWSFSACSVRYMLERAGYECNGPDKEAHGLSVIAQRYDPPTPREEWPLLEGILSKEKTVKILCGLDLVPQRRILSWRSDGDGCAWTTAQGSFTRSMVVEPHSEFITDAPIEVAFPERVEMFVK